MLSKTIRNWFLITSAGAIAACSAAGNDSPADMDAAAGTDSPVMGMDASMGVDSNPGMDSSMTLDGNMVRDGGSDARRDTGPVDSGADVVVVRDGSFDPPGTACSPNNQVQRDPLCGVCGFRDRVCLALTDGGTPTWQVWGACQSEVAGGCLPGSADINAPCGFCGTQIKRCQNDCSYAVGGCTGTGMCAAGSSEFAASVSCDAGLGRTRSCDNACMWGSYSTTCTAPPPWPYTITVSATVGNKVTQQFTMAASPKIPKVITGSCPTTVSSSSTSASWVKLINPTASVANVSVWGSKATTGAIVDTIMAIYPATAGGDPPSSTADRNACTGFVGDSCGPTGTDATACLNSWAGFVKDDSATDNSISIPANSYVWAYTAAYFTFESGDYLLSTKTH